MVDLNKAQQDQSDYPVGCRVVPNDQSLQSRADEVRDLRIIRANIMHDQPLPPDPPPCNREEDDPTYAAAGTFIASYSKALRHDADTGEVEHDAYCALLQGLKTSSVQDFDSVVGPFHGVEEPSGPSFSAEAFSQISVSTAGAAMRLRFVNPLSSQAFELEGADSNLVQLFDWGRFDAAGNVRRIPFPPPPRFDSPDEIAEMAEVYWMALSRDVRFLDYSRGPEIVRNAIDSLNKFPYFERIFGGPVTDRNLFRGALKGDLVGPYVSQFLVRPIPYAAFTIDPRIRTVLAVGERNQRGEIGSDYMTSWRSWSDIQRGLQPPPINPCRERDRFNDDPTLILRGRDIGQYVHADSLYEQYVAACQLLQAPRDECAPIPLKLTVPEGKDGPNSVGGGFFAGLDPLQCGNPYRAFKDPKNTMDVSPCPDGTGSKFSQGFGTLGVPDVKVLLAEAAKRALKAAWYQKWAVHRRLRPEEFGGRIHAQQARGRKYPFDREAFSKLEADVLPAVRAHNNRIHEIEGGDREPSYLLPMAFPEGCPVHPAYPQGHATVAGACVTVLKAMFLDVDLTDPRFGVTLVEPTSPDTLTRYEIPSDEMGRITVHGELNKLASNIGLARDFAGVHWRSDYYEGLRLGETVAIWMLCDIRNTYKEHFAFAFETFDGHQIEINRDFDGCFQVNSTEAQARM